MEIVVPAMPGWFARIMVDGPATSEEVRVPIAAWAEDRGPLVIGRTEDYWTVALVPLADWRPNRLQPVKLVVHEIEFTPGYHRDQHILLGQPSAPGTTIYEISDAEAQ